MTLLKTIIRFLIAGVLWSSTVTAKANFPFPHHTVYKNTISPSLYSQHQLDKYTLNYYRNWKQRYLVHEAGNLYRIATDKENKSRTVSEGQGYGMMLVAYFAGADPDAQKIFNGLFRYVRKHPSGICRDLMAWETPEKKGDADSAFDGDADIAYALLVAHRQWGSDGEINYLKEAKRILTAIKKCTLGRKSHLPLLGDWVDQNGKKYNQYTTRSSDFMISHFRTFYAYDHDPKWLQVVSATQKALQEIQKLPQNSSNLVSDFLYYNIKRKHFFPTERHFLEKEDDSYYYNACRVPWRIGVDYLLNHDAASYEISQKMLYRVWLYADKKPQNIKSGYHLDGSVIGNYPSTAFIAPFGVAAKGNPQMQEFLDLLYDYIKNRYDNYYEDTINLICQLIISNNYWDPAQIKKAR